MIDRYTRWPEVIPIPNITAETVADSFLLHWVARFGVPHTVTTDRGAQFESQLWKELLLRLGSIKIRTTAYHPQANGLIERFHRRLKDALRAHANDDAQVWLKQIPLILLTIRTALREDAAVSPAEALYGETLIVPGDIISPPKESIDITTYSNRLANHMRSLSLIHI